MGRDREPDAVQTASLIAPAHSEKAGGDFYLVDRAGPLTTIVVGDVAGKGERVAPYAARAREVATRCVHDATGDPARVLECLNAVLYEDASFDLHVAASAIVIDSLVRSAKWAFAGHVPPLWLDTGTPIDGAVPGYLLGLEPSCGATSAERRPLRRGEGFVLYTDGLEDVVGPGGDRFGTVRITHTLANSLYGADPQEVVDGLKRAACEFGGGELYDDVCIVVARLP